MIIVKKKLIYFINNNKIIKIIAYSPYAPSPKTCATSQPSTNSPPAAIVLPRAVTCNISELSSNSALHAVLIIAGKLLTTANEVSA
ncbi:unnamed protein product [Arctia plantaginis]|uniref:Uncharacterized protein n=1 Tax=Arctia plantaginis TaxID=874455 RepID=A0A8S0YYA2_ARCPL|nr:unnamed protein product [Arctia plantaginis]